MQPRILSFPHAFPYLPYFVGRHFPPRPTRFDWAELTLSEAYRRHLHLSHSPSPPFAEINHPFFQPPTTTEISELHGHSLAHWRDNIHLYRPLRTVANHRKTTVHFSNIHNSAFSFEFQISQPIYSEIGVFLSRCFHHWISASALRLTGKLLKHPHRFEKIPSLILPHLSPAHGWCHGHYHGYVPKHMANQPINMESF